MTSLPQSSISTLLSLLQQHLAWYPKMEILDVYKLLYQGSLGPEHLVATQQEFTRRLQAEFDDQIPDPGGRLVEPVRSDQTLFRINLRPYKAVSSNIERLISPLLKTSRLFQADHTVLTRGWSEFTQVIERGELPVYTMPEITRFNRWLLKNKYPPVHHSETYRTAYQPAYRLILAQFVDGLVSHVAG